MEITEFKYFLDGSSAKSFIAICDDGKKWVIRCKKKDKNSKRLFSEYFAGRLAIEFGLNHPETKIVKVPPFILKDLNNIDNIFDEKCYYGVATLYIENLISIKPPNIRSYLDPELPRINLTHLKKELSQVKNIDQIYALKVFSHWVYLADYHKYENLKLTSSHEILYLDFDLCFESNDNSWGDLPEYSFIKIKTNQAPFLEGFTNDINPFMNWLSKLEGLSQQNIRNGLDNIPGCWAVPESYIDMLFYFLFEKRSDYIVEFKHAIEFQNDLMSFD